MQKTWNPLKQYTMEKQETLLMDTMQNSTEIAAGSPVLLSRGGMPRPFLITISIIAMDGTTIAMWNICDPFLFGSDIEDSLCAG